MQVSACRYSDQGIDTSTDMGKVFFQISGIFAEYERNKILERTQAGIARARENGTRFGRANRDRPRKSQGRAGTKQDHDGNKSLPASRPEPISLLQANQGSIDHTSPEPIHRRVGSRYAAENQKTPFM